MNLTLIWIIGYILIINLAGFIMMGADKSKARNNAWRIPEAALFFVAIIGGSIGSITGMQVFRHKTRHWYFKYGMPLILILQITLIVLVFKYFNISIM